MKQSRYFIIGCSLFFFFNISFVNAQALNFGFKGGVNASYFQGSYIYAGDDFTLNLNPDLSARFSAGGLVRYNITEVTSIQSELLYTTRGVRFDQNVDLRNQTLRLKGDLTLTYMELPVFLRVSTTLPDHGKWFSPEPGFTFNAYTGGSFAYKTNAKFSGILSGEVLGDDYSERFENRVWDQFTDTDFSFIVGAGFEYGVQYRFTFDVRYVISITDIGSDPEFPDDVRNGKVSVFIGMVF